jgi:hypothetical protein
MKDTITRSYYIVHVVGGEPKLFKANGPAEMDEILRRGDHEYRVEGFGSKDARDEQYKLQMIEIQEEAEFEISLNS